MTIRIACDSNVPAEVQAMIGRYLPPVLRFVPTEYHELRIGWTSENDGSALAMRGMREYRWAKLTVRPGFLTEPPYERCEAVVHEVAHLIVEPVNAELLHLLDCLEQQKQWTAEMVTQWRERRRHALELVVCDVTRHLMAQIPTHEWPSE